MTGRWDIFCRAVDNFGDVGVCWRLARILVQEHGLRASLVADDLSVLARMAPGVDPGAAQQEVAGVAIRDWTAATASPTSADVVVEAFGCGIPEAYQAAMAARPKPPGWFVLEYLSAEPWVDGAHGLPSPHPRLPLQRRYWFPGFTAAAGGLLRERDLFDRRDRFGADTAARDAFWQSLRIAPGAQCDLRISLFCYPSPALSPLFDAWAGGDQPVCCIVPEGVAAGSLDAWNGGAVPRVGRPIVRGRLALHAIPFLAQDDYDRLLWSCDANVVRGEDSFVRAQWAARPFAWQAYPQAEGAHLRKLDAFLDRYAAELKADVAATVRRFFAALNGGCDPGAVAAAWLDWARLRPHLETHGTRWADALARLPELASGLVKAARNAL